MGQFDEVLTPNGYLQLTAQVAKQQQLINKLMRYMPTDADEDDDVLQVPGTLPSRYSTQVSSNHFNDPKMLDIQVINKVFIYTTDC